MFGWEVSYLIDEKTGEFEGFVEAGGGYNAVLLVRVECEISDGLWVQVDVFQRAQVLRVHLHEAKKELEQCTVSMPKQQNTFGFFEA